MEIRYVAQEDPDGCLVAAVAMVLGKTYQETKRAVWTAYHRNPKSPGIYETIAEELLAQHGFAYVKRYHFDPVTQEKRADWPPAPFAPIHLAYVNTPTHHAVVLLAEGTVLDPNSRTRTRLTDYVSVDQVCGIFRVFPE